MRFLVRFSEVFRLVQEEDKTGQAGSHGLEIEQQEIFMDRDAIVCLFLGHFIVKWDDWALLGVYVSSTPAQQAHWPV